jgi:PRTRC genetic system protein B
MNNITSNFGTLYLPKKAFVVYHAENGNNIYVESYDMDEEGYPINAHPLSVREANALAKTLDTSDDMKRSFLKPRSLMPRNVLHINPDQNGYALWHTPPQAMNLLFTGSLGIPSGIAYIPALLWKASKEYLQVYALKNTELITEQTVLYNAPFFNIHENGKVCMGTVRIKIDSECMLEDFMAKWQEYFFDSYFSHLIGNNSPVKGNIVQLWKSLVNTKKLFPEKVLQPTRLTLKNLLS